MTEGTQRASRKDGVAQERRRRRDETIDGSLNLKLAIPPDVAERLKREGRTPRWALNDPQRIYNLTQRDDYDVVEGVEGVPTKKLSDGGAASHILLSKPTAFIEEDRERIDAKRRQTERDLMAGTVEGATLPGDVSYADKSNSIDTGYRPRL